MWTELMLQFCGNLLNIALYLNETWSIFAYISNVNLKCSLSQQYLNIIHPVFYLHYQFISTVRNLDDRVSPM